ncbi:MAG: hypothetical protein AB7L65_04900 [Hyphomonadaceae bacterium]
MKKFVALMATAGALALAAPAFADAPWQSINQRQVQLDQRIDMGVRNGSLTRSEALNLRAQFNQIAMLERTYRRDGLNLAERRDLDRRFNNLSSRIAYERHDADARTWVSINQRQRNLDTRIDAGVRDRSLSYREAQQLRAEFRHLSALETRYRRSGGGLSYAERVDLDRRFDRLSTQIRAERRDRDNHRG